MDVPSYSHILSKASTSRRKKRRERERKEEKKQHPPRYRPDSLTSMTMLRLFIVERQGSLSKRTQRNHLDLQTGFWMNHKTPAVNSSRERSESICSSVIHQQDKDSPAPQPSCNREEEKLGPDLNSKIKCLQSPVKWSGAVKRLEEYTTTSKNVPVNTHVSPQWFPYSPCLTSVSNWYPEFLCRKNEKHSEAYKKLLGGGLE